MEQVQEMARDLHTIRLCVELGFADAEMAAQWADMVIKAEPSAESTFCELSLLAEKRPADVLDLLSAYPVANCRPESWAKMLSWIAVRVRNNQIDAGDVISRINHFTMQPGSETSYIAEQFNWLDDSYKLAKDQVAGSLAEVRETLLQELDDLCKPQSLEKLPGPKGN